MIGGVLRVARKCHGRVLAGELDQRVPRGSGRGVVSAGGRSAERVE